MLYQILVLHYKTIPPPLPPLQAKLAGIPVYPAMVLGGLFFMVLIGSYLLVFIPAVRIVRWF